MKTIKQMLLGIAIMVAAIACNSVWDSDTVTVIIAIIGLLVVICGYAHEDGETKDVQS